VLILVLKEEGEAVLYFLDNWLGIPSEIQGKIFDPFYSRKGNQEDV
jgi:C4-dicarboxylate-specific signal transduction histidine kinase